MTLDHLEVQDVVVVVEGRIAFYVILNNVIMPPLKEEGVYCFANVGRLVGMSVGR